MYVIVYYVYVERFGGAGFEKRNFDGDNNINYDKRHVDGGNFDKRQSDGGSFAKLFVGSVPKTATEDDVSFIYLSLLSFQLC